MKTTFVKSRRNLIKCYGPVGFICLLYCGLGGKMVYGFLTSTGGRGAKDYFFFALGCLLFAVAAYTVVRFFKNAPIITVDKRKITFNRAAYPWPEVARIDLTGNNPSGIFTGIRKKGLSSLSGMAR